MISGLVPLEGEIDNMLSTPVLNNPFYYFASPIVKFYFNYVNDLRYYWIPGSDMEPNMYGVEPDFYP